MADAWCHLFIVATLEVHRIKEQGWSKSFKCLGSECELRNIHETFSEKGIYRIALKDGDSL